RDLAFEAVGAPALRVHDLDGHRFARPAIEGAVDRGHTSPRSLGHHFEAVAHQGAWIGHRGSLAEFSGGIHRESPNLAVAATASALRSKAPTRRARGLTT